MSLPKLPNISELFSRSEYLDKKVKTGTATTYDFDELKRLSELFSRLNKHAESLFCKKLQVKFLYREYQSNTNYSAKLTILEDAHALAIDIVIYAETKKVIAASFYRSLLYTKNELAKLRRNLGFLKDAESLEKCAVQIYKKAKTLFPTYERFSNSKFL